ncbi:hypothetical protein Ddc_18637 [Ditylenchus destructor]|nr:hypothetical protein Ddc_18637 [Ditylenchus destructor]
MLGSAPAVTKEGRHPSVLLTADCYAKKMRRSDHFDENQEANLENEPQIEPNAKKSRSDIIISGVFAKETFQSGLGSGRMIYESLPLDERKRLVPDSPTKIDSSVIYDFRKIPD